MLQIIHVMQFQQMHLFKISFAVPDSIISIKNSKSIVIKRIFQLCIYSNTQNFFIENLFFYYEVIFHFQQQ